MAVMHVKLTVFKRSQKSEFRGSRKAKGLWFEKSCSGSPAIRGHREYSRCSPNHKASSVTRRKIKRKFESNTEA